MSLSGGLEAHDIHFGGARLAAWSAGRAEAPVLVFCHGGALDHSSFRSLAARYCRDFRVILWDLPSHGLSQGLAAPFTAAACAKAMEAVMDQLGAQDALAIGFSFGGVVAQAAAKARPDLVRRLIAYGCLSPHVGKPILPEALATAAVNRRFGPMDWPSIRKCFGQLCCITPEGQAKVEMDMAPVGKRCFLAMARANLIAAGRGGPFRIHGGVDLLAGALDSNADAIWRTFEAFETAYPAARKRLIPDAGHCAHLDRPEAFASALDQLIN